MARQVQPTDYRGVALEFPGGGGSGGDSVVAKLYNPPFKFSNDLKVLEIGNSFSLNALTYVSDMLSAAGITNSSQVASNFCLYRCVRGGSSFKSWYDIYHDQDDSTKSYGISKTFGGRTISGIVGTGYGNDGTLFRKLIQEVKWDVINIHQASDYSADYDVWNTHEAGGYLTEFMRILKTFQPQATIGFLFTHVSNSQANGNTSLRFDQMATATKQFTQDYGVDFVIPVGAALENIRASSANTTNYGFSEDDHHLAAGMGKYVASATYFQALLAPVFGLTIYGNTFRHTVTPEEIAGAAARYADEFVSVTNDNAGIAQMSVLLAINDMYSINNPNNIQL